MVVGVIDASVKESLLDYYYDTYGEAGAVDAMIADLQTGTVPEGYESTDLFGVLLELEVDLDPDDPSLAYLWNDETGEMLQGFWYNNAADSELTALIADVEGFMENCGIDTGTLAMTETIITDYVNEFGPLEYGSSSDSLGELDSLLSIIRWLNPGLYMIVRSQELSQLVAEDMENLLDDQAELYEQLNDLAEDAEGLTDAEDAAELQAIQFEMKQIEAIIEMYNEVMKLLQDMVSKSAEVGSDIAAQQSRTASTIIGNG